MRTRIIDKMLSVLLVLTMIMSLVPTVSFAAANISNSYTYGIAVKIADQKNAGTDSDIFALVKLHDGMTHQFKIDSGADDHERGDCRTYYFDIDCQPFEIKQIGIKNGGKDAMRVQYFVFYMPNNVSFSRDIWQWLSRGDGYPSEMLYDVTSNTKRSISDKSGFSDMGGTLYVDRGASPSNVVKTWGGNITDQYFNQYNFFEQYGARSVEFSVSSKSYTGYGKLTTDILNKKTYDAGDNGKYENGYEINTKSVLNTMRSRGIYKLEIISEMNWNGSSVYNSNMSQTYRIIRKEFALEGAYITTSAYSPMQDNYFHNNVKEYKTFTVRVPVKSMDNYDANTVAKSLASRINSKSGPVVKIFYDKVENNGGKNYITPSKVTSTGRYIDFVCTAPDGFANVDNTGITAVIENPSAVYSSQTYTADKYSSYISKNKVDTKGVTFTLKDSDDNAISGFDTYKKEHSFKLDITGGNPWTVVSGAKRQEGNFSYRLYNKKNMSEEVPLVKHNGLAATSNVAHAGNAVYRIAADGKAVEGEYVLKVSARDFANNEETLTANVKLDTIAPRASHKLNEVSAVDGSKRYEFKFDIEDASNTGRLHYVLVRDGYSVPSADDTKPETSGPEDTYFEKWGFIDQLNYDAQTVVVSAEKGEVIKGRLYWYTTDEAGNDSRNESASGKIDKLNYTDFILNNEVLEADIIIKDKTPALTDYEITFETNENNVITYRWIGNYVVTPLMTYKGETIGSRHVTNGSGQRFVLDGDFTLQYTVTNSTTGNKKTYTEKFVFDNSAPTLNITAMTSDIGPVAKFRLHAEDRAGVDTLKYQLFTASGEAIGEETELLADLYAVSNEITVAPEATGAYKLQVTTIDNNGYTTVKMTDVFSIRNAAPELEIRAEFEDYIDNVAVIGNEGYSFDIRVKEEISDALDFEENQTLYYRVSLDGIDYTEWTENTDGLMVTNKGIEDSLTLVSPLALNEGENLFFVQAFIATKGIDPEKVKTELIAVNSDLKIIYDASAPQYKLHINDSEITNKSVTGTITVIDNYTAPEDIELFIDGNVIIGTGEVFGNEITYPIEITYNCNSVIEVVDKSGNKTEAPVVVDCIDKDAPTVELKDAYPVYSGNRTDYYLSFYVDEAIDENTKFALVEGYYAPSASWNPETGEYDVPVVYPDDMKDEIFEQVNEAIAITNRENVFDYETGVTKTYYEVLVRAGEEIIPEGTTDENGDGVINGMDLDWDVWAELNSKNYILVARAEDQLGNMSKSSVGYGFALENATADIAEYWANPEKAGSKTSLAMQLTVPGYVLPDSKVPESIKDKNLADGRIDDSSDSEVAEFAEFVANSASSFTDYASAIISGYGDYSFYITDDVGRVYKRTVTVDEEMVTFGVEPPAIVKFYTAPEGDTDINRWTQSMPEALDFANYDYYVAVEADPAYEGGNVVFTDVINESYSEESDFCLEYYLSEKDENWDYTKLIYSLNETENTNKIFSYEAKVTVPAAVEGGEATEDYIGGAEEFSFKDVSAPDIYSYYSTKGYTNKDVYVTVAAYDSELAVSTDASDSANIGENDGVTVGSVAAQAAGISGIRVSDLLSVYDDTSDVSTLNMTDLGEVSETVLKFETNGKVLVEVTNTLGLVGYEEIIVENINKEAIAEGDHYTVSYEYEDHEGNLLPIDEDGYYKNVIAKLEITYEGIERGVYIASNGGVGEKKLDNYDSSFTFTLRDVYGNEAEADVEFTKFDLDGPVITYELANTKKTNQPVDIILTANDIRSGTGNITLSDVEGREIPTTGIDHNNYKATLTNGGSYRITATDKLGNVSYRTFAVTNIDTVKPNVIDMVYTTEDITTQMVGVKLYYDKQNVKITAAAPVEGGALSENEVAVDYNSSVVRFDDNGSVAVEFTDEYGNTNTDIITVENINRTPPSVVPVAMVASDLLSVDISFELETDEYGVPVDKMRTLEDLYVMHHGIAKKVREFKSEIVDGKLKEEVVDAVYTITENGKYKFYVYDFIGNTQIIEVTVDEIDRRSPTITSVTWTYDYMDENGEMQNASHTVEPVGEVGYNVAEDIYNPTNQDVKVIVETDLGTKFVGSNSKDYTTSHEVVFDQNGWFNFYLERQNKLMARYGVGIYIIDKIPPVIEDVEDLMFFENPNAGSAYSKDLLKFNAYDLKDGKKINLNADVKIDYGTFNPDDIKANTFDKNKPYEITYTVRDAVGNETVVKRRITLVGLFDTMARVNGIYPDSSGRIEIIGDSVEISLDNFSGTAYARYEKGVYTMGEMKHKGSVIANQDGKFKLDKLTDGWYTFYVQTDLRDYFNINVYIYNK